MPKVILVKKETGKLEGLGVKNERAFGKYRRTVDDLEVGETIVFSYKLPRSPRHHGFFFSKLGELFDRQERFATEDHLRSWLIIGAGFADLVPGRDGIPCAIAQSIDWDNCDEHLFTEITRGVEEFMWTDHAQQTLWPHLNAARRHENVLGWHETAEKNRQLAIARRQERTI